MRNFLRGRLIVFGAILLMVGLWWLASLRVGEVLLLPSPLDVVRKVFSLLGKRETYSHVFASFLRMAEGVILSGTMGIFLGIASGKNEVVFTLLRPWLVVFQSLPAIVWILIALIWLPRESVSFWLVFLTTFPLWVLQIRQAILHVDGKLLEMAEVFALTGWRRWYAIYFPPLLLHLLIGLRSTLTLSLKVVVMAEVLSFPQFGVGTKLFWAKTYVNVEELFAWALLVFLLGWIMDSTLGICEAWVQKIPGLGKL